MRKIIAISGVARAGKDTFADAYIRHRGGVKLPLAGNVREDLITKGLATPEEVAEKGPRVRKLLQWYGTDVMRAFDAQYWLHRWCRSYVELGDGPPVLVPDVRFPDELAFFEGVASTVVYVDAEERLAYEIATAPFRQHASEVGIPALGRRVAEQALAVGLPWCYLTNNGDLPAFERRVRDLLDALYPTE